MKGRGASAASLPPSPRPSPALREREQGVPVRLNAGSVQTGLRNTSTASAASNTNSVRL